MRKAVVLAPMIDVTVLYSAGGVATQILLSHRGADILVDAGDGVLRDLIARSYDFARLKAILLTHEDFDHISGLYALVSAMRNYHTDRPRAEPLTIVAPKPLHHLHLLLQPPPMYRAPPFPVQLEEVVGGQTLSLRQLVARPFELSTAPNAARSSDTLSPTPPASRSS